MNASLALPWRDRAGRFSPLRLSVLVLDGVGAVALGAWRIPRA
jgi:hypothetical protein